MMESDHQMAIDLIEEAVAARIRGAFYRLYLAGYLQPQDGHWEVHENELAAQPAY